MSPVAKRPSARLLVLDGQNRVLLFKFVFNDGPLAGKQFWATPGGAVDPGETFEQAAKRELFEETGIQVETLSKHVAERQFTFVTSEGKEVLAEERYFVVRVRDEEIKDENQTDEEKYVVLDHRWWQLEELRTMKETVFPEDLAEMVARAVICP